MKPSTSINLSATGSRSRHQSVSQPIKKLSERLRNLGLTVAYHPHLALVLGDVKQCLFLSQLILWLGKEKSPDKGIYKSQRELFLETGLSEFEQRGVREALRVTSVLKCFLQSRSRAFLR